MSPKILTGMSGNLKQAEKSDHLLGKTDKECSLPVIANIRQEESSLCLHAHTVTQMTTQIQLSVLIPVSIFDVTK